MLEFIDSGANVMALKLSGTISGTDLDAIMDDLDQRLERSGMVHMFVETMAIDGIEISSLPSYVARAMPLFGKLARFGRVAVVADQAWVRLGTRLESALLPGISYRTYLPEERDEALAWAMGTSDE